MRISLTSNIARFERKVKKIHRKQLPFAIHRALNATAFDARESLQKKLPSHIDRPTPWLVKAVQVKKSTKKNLVARVGFAGSGFGKGKGYLGAEPPSDIMTLLIKGGTRTPTHRSVAVPTQIFMSRLNKYGNLKRNQISKLINKKGNFSGKPRGRDLPVGIYKRYGHHKIERLVTFKKTQQYRPQFPFRPIAIKAVRAKFAKNFRREWASALRTAR